MRSESSINSWTSRAVRLRIRAVRSVRNTSSAERIPTAEAVARGADLFDADGIPQIGDGLGDDGVGVRDVGMGGYEVGRGGGGDVDVGAGGRAVEEVGGYGQVAGAGEAVGETILPLVFLLFLMYGRNVQSVLEQLDAEDVSQIYQPDLGDTVAFGRRYVEGHWRTMRASFC